MESSRWYLVVGYGGGAVARVAFATESQAVQARQQLIDAYPSIDPDGRHLFVPVTSHAGLTAADIRFIYIERED